MNTASAISFCMVTAIITASVASRKETRSPSHGVNSQKTIEEMFRGPGLGNICLLRDSSIRGAGQLDHIIQ